MKLGLPCTEKAFITENKEEGRMIAGIQKVPQHFSPLSSGWGRPSFFCLRQMPLTVYDVKNKNNEMSKERE